MTSTERSKNFGSPCAKDVMPIIMSRQKTCLFSFIFQNGTYLITLAVLTKHLDCFTLTLCVTNHCGNLNNLEQVPQVNIFKTWQPFYLISYRNCTPQRVACRRNWELLLCFLMKGVTGAICLRYLAKKKKCLKLSLSKSIPCGTNVLHVIFLANKIFKPFIFIGHCKPKEVPKCSKKT